MPIQIVSVVENIVVFLCLLLIVLLCVKDTVINVMATMTIKSVTNAYKAGVKPDELVIDDDKSLIRLASPIAGIVKKDDGGYEVGQKTEMSLFNTVIRKLVHLGLEQFKMRAILEDALDNADNTIGQCRQWLRGAIVDIEVTEEEKVNKETGEITKTVNYSFSNVHLAIPEDEQFLLFMNYMAEKGYNEFMIKMMAKKFDIEL